MIVRWYNAVLFDGETLLGKTSFLTDNGRIVAVGEENGSSIAVEREVNLEGAFVTPPFADMHTHPSYVAQTLGCLACTPPGVTSIEALVEGLRQEARKLPDDAWVEGWGYDESLLAEGRSPTREDLDCVATDRPVFIRRSDCHSAVVNTFLLRAAGITRTTPDPAGGRIGRDALGEPDGRLIETSAVRLVENLRGSAGMESKVERMRALGEHYFSRGIGTVTEMMTERGDKDLLPVWRAVRNSGVSLSVGLYLTWTGGTDSRGLPDLEPDDKVGPVRYVGLKLFADGSISGRTAALTRRYRDGSQGTMCLTRDVFEAGLAWARRNDVQLSIHVMGDRSLDELLSWLENVAPWRRNEPSVRLEHVSIVRPDQLERIAVLPTCPALTTQTVFPFAEWRGYEEALSRHDIDATYPVRSIAKRIKAFALSSDAPATTWNDPDQPFVTIAAAVTRRDARGVAFGSGEAVSLETALTLYTSRAALVSDLGYTGRLQKGGLADFVLWDANPFELPLEDLALVRAKAFYLGAEPVWSRRAP